MNFEILDFESKEDTGQQMAKDVESFYLDLGPFLKWSFESWFDYVRLIPYTSDFERFPKRVIELLSRPKFLLDRFLFPKIDCKKKAILIASWARGHGLAYRFLAVSQKPNKSIHHVFPQIDFGGGWVNVDATFPCFRIGQGQSITYGEELKKNESYSGFNARSI